MTSLQLPRGRSRPNHIARKRKRSKIFFDVCRLFFDLFLLGMNRSLYYYFGLRIKPSLADVLLVQLVIFILPNDLIVGQQTKLWGGNVFTPVCQSFCSQGDLSQHAMGRVVYHSMQWVEGMYPSMQWGCRPLLDTHIPGHPPGLTPPSGKIPPLARPRFHWKVKLLQETCTSWWRHPIIFYICEKNCFSLTFFPLLEIWNS